MKCKACACIVETTKARMVKVGSKKYYYCSECYKKLLDTTINIIKNNREKKN